MTVSNDRARKNHVGTGVVTEFAYDFLVLQESHLEVYLDDVLQESGYTVTGIAEDTGGSVIFTVAPADGVIVTLRRWLPIVQGADYIDYDRFSADGHERALDLVVMICAQLLDQLGRNLTVALSADADLDLTLPGRDAGKALMWDESDKKLINSTDNFNNVVSLAQAAQGAAETARDLAIAARDTANTHVTSADAARAAAVVAQLAAEAAQAAAEIAETNVLNFPATSNEWEAVQYYKYRTVNPVGSTLAIDFSDDPLLLLGVQGNFTVTFSNLGYDKACVLQMWNNSGSGHTITWPSTIRWMDGVDTDSPPSGKTKFIHLWSTPTKVFASVTWEGDS